jgi:hypothetical protein
MKRDANFGRRDLSSFGGEKLDVNFVVVQIAKNPVPEIRGVDLERYVGGDEVVVVDHGRWNKMKAVVDPDTDRAQTIGVGKDTYDAEGVCNMEILIFRRDDRDVDVVAIQNGDGTGGALEEEGGTRERVPRWRVFGKFDSRRRLRGRKEP